MFAHSLLVVGWSFIVNPYALLHFWGFRTENFEVQSAGREHVQFISILYF